MLQDHGCEAAGQTCWASWGSSEPPPPSLSHPVSDPEPAPLSPSWLLQDPRLLLRTTNKGFTEAVEKYFDHLIPRVIPLQVKPNYLLHLSYMHFPDRAVEGRGTHIKVVA